MKVSTKKMTMRDLRVRIAAVGILTIEELAERIDTSRTSIYLAVERPSRYPNVFRKIQEVIAPKEVSK